MSMVSVQAASTDMRQLRHHTRNALASILSQLCLGLRATDESRRMAAELERRVLLTSQIADALFGFTRAPGSFADRVLTLCEGVVDLLAEPDQCITLLCRVDGRVLPALEETVLRLANEFVGNAVKHGMCVRVIGRIEATVTAQADGVVLEVSDDGWGCGRAPVFGEGLGVARALAGSAGGQIALFRRGDRTIAQAILPPGDHV